MTAAWLVVAACFAVITVCIAALHRLDRVERETRRTRTLQFGSTRWARDRWETATFDGEVGGADAIAGSSTQLKGE